jgi:hypothetical protein
VDERFDEPARKKRPAHAGFILAGARRSVARPMSPDRPSRSAARELQRSLITPDFITL